MAMAAFVESGAGAPRDLAPGWTREPSMLLARQVVQEGLLAPAVRVAGNFEAFGRGRVRGIDPPLIIAANHASHVDVIAIREALPRAWRHDLVAAAAADYFFESGSRRLLFSLAFNTLPLERHESPRQSLRTAVKVLRQGAALIIFPEGGRLDGAPRLREFAPGVGFLAKHARVPVVPVAVWGTHEALPKGRRLPRTAHIRVQVGRPIEIAEGERPQAFTLRVREAVRAAAVELGAWPLVYGEGDAPGA
ncbi:MAG: 1-acyl-sn-glycerol-3-phosphate acyltransferase [Chloroflexota bacterium]|jgi:1-acyl-sn-glycerol-3-phosphate acyltransferase|nr:1-acyl-sn-glycerol-3-phosphate acyltransferase [Chloroflexota bacterium]